MIVLSQTTDNLQVVLAGAVTANQLPVIASWRDITTSAYTPGRSTSTSNSTTDATIVAAPAASTQRVIDSIWIWNRDTASASVTVKYDANGTEYILGTWALGVGERLEYSTSAGWLVFTAQGGLKTVQSYAAPVGEINTVILASDVVNNNAVANTIADVTGLSFPVTAGETYWFEYLIAYTAALNTTGSRWSINGPGAPTLLSYRSEYTITATTQTINFLSAYDSPAASNAGGLTVGNTARVTGIITPSANGTVIARFASEVLSSAITAKAGSVLRWQRTL